MKQNFSNLKKFRSRAAMKHKLYAAVITVLVLAAVIVVNILASAIAQRFHTSLDLTIEGRNSVTRENIDYIRGINKDVYITVCASEDGYTGQYMAYYAAYYHMAQDTTGQYYQQALTLIQEYTAYNKNIHIAFADPQTPAFAQIQSRYPGANLAYGDILVECSFDLDGAAVNRSKILTYTDIYELSDPTGYTAYFGGYYVVSGSKIETALTGAIYAVTSEKTTHALLIDRNAAANTDTLAENLELNNYVVDTVRGVLTAIPEDTDLLLIAAPTADFAPDELALIEAFLDKGADRGLLYFASIAAPALPRLGAFLEEWGVRIQSGILYETNENYRLLDAPTEMALANKRTDYTADINGSNIGFAAGNLVPLQTAYESYQNRRTAILMATSDSVTAAPLGADETYVPEGALTSYPAAVLTTDSTTGSYVTVFASDDFISGRWDQYATIDNMRFVRTVANRISGVSATDISFSSRVIVSGMFYEAPTQAAILTMRAIFVRILPLAVLVVGVVVWFRRKHR